MADTPEMPNGNETINYGNVMIKAFTVDKDAIAVSLNVESFGQDGQSLGNQIVTDFSTPVELPDLLYPASARLECSALYALL